MSFIPNRIEPYRPPKESEPEKKPIPAKTHTSHPEEVKRALREHRQFAHGVVVSGETQKTSEEQTQEEVQVKRARFRLEEESRLLAPRIIWWMFVVSLGVSWLYEISIFTWWWGWIGAFIGFVIGIPLLPVFPILALLQGSYGIALSDIILFSFLSMTFLYSWPEMSRFIRGLRRRSG